MIDADLLSYLTPEEREEIEALLAAPTLPDLDALLFPEQKAFLQDPSRRKAVLSTRRGGKSISTGVYLLKTALSRPNSQCMYIGITRDSAKRIMWEPILKKYNTTLSLGGHPNESALTLRFSNGSIIYLVGMDNTDNEQEKIKGLYLDLVCIDEAASYTIDLKKLVEETIAPATIDRQGTICLIGTPGDNIYSYFADITRDIPTNPPTRTYRMGWSIHTWSALNNPYISSYFQSEITRLKQENPNIYEDPGFRQHYLGEWVSDISSRVYAYQPDRNDATSLPTFPTKWKYTFGIDLGFNDDTAIAVLAYNEHCPDTYIVFSEGRPKQTITDTANWIKQLYAKYSPETMVVDGASKQAVQEIIQHHNLPLIPAEKQDKANFIKIMNSEFIAGRIKLLPGTESLKKSYQSLIWDKKAFEKGIYKELSSLPNHENDASLYGYRYTYSYCYRPLAPLLTYQEKVEKVEQLRVQDMHKDYLLRKQEEAILNPLYEEGLHDDYYSS